MRKILALVIAAAVLALAVLFILKITKRPKPVNPVGVKTVSHGSLVNRAQDLEAKGDLLAAKKSYQELLGEFSNSKDITKWEKKLEDLNMRLLFSNIVTPGSVSYEIKPGDTLTKIAKLYKTTVDLIMRSNNLSSANISPGRKIKVWNLPFSIAVDKSQNKLILKTNDEVFKTYIVSTGTNNSTPVGNFKITNKLINPTWFKAGAVVPAGSPENILGTRWLGIDQPTYGIHGTTMPQDLGKQVTAGCVRMANADVEELYTIVPAGTEVTIVD